MRIREAILKKVNGLKHVALLLAMVWPLSGNGQNLNDLGMEQTKHKYGIVGQIAPELNVPIWIDKEGLKTESVLLSSFEGKFKVIYCFQAWCPGCHSQGLPSLKEMVSALGGSDKVAFFAVQTVFEGKHANTEDRMKEIQKEYDLKIPFGHDVGDAQSRNRSTIMGDYRTGGTPWFIFIDKENRVVFNDYHLNTKAATKYLKRIE